MSESSSNPPDVAGVIEQTSANSAARTLTLSKSGHHFCFRYERGDEPAVLASLVEAVERRNTPLDWFDAAVLSHQLGRHLAGDIKGLKIPPAPNKKAA